MYETGEGVTENSFEAIRWYVEAAESGLLFAQAALGSIYADGVGVPKDNTLAYLWWSLAAAQDHKIAAKNLGILTNQMTAEEIAKGDLLVEKHFRKSE